MDLCKTSDPKRGAIFDSRATIWTTLVEVHWMKLHTKYQRPGPSGFRQENFLSFQLNKNLFLAPVRLWPRCAMGQNHLNNFERGPTKDHSYEDCSKSNQWFRRCRLKNCLRMHARTQARTNTRQTKCDHKSYVTSELKIEFLSENFQFRRWNFLYIWIGMFS